MIISWEQMNDYSDPFGRRIFRGEVTSDIESWKSSLPDLGELAGVALASPSLEEILGRGSEGVDGLSQYVGRLAMSDWVRGTRQMIGELAMTTGILSSSLGSIDIVFKSHTNDLLNALDVAGQVLDSELFEMAMNSIGAIPIVGWIIKIVYEVANAIANIVIMSLEMNEDAARAVVSQNLTIPMSSTDFSVYANNAKAQELFHMVRYNPERIFLPAYEMDPGSPNFGFIASGVYDDSERESVGKEGWGAGWVVRGEHVTGYAGYVPGTSSMTDSIFLRNSVVGNAKANNLGGIRDMASLFPTAQSLATTWWSNINKPGPSMFSVKPKSAIGEWQSYIRQMYRLARDLNKGWGMHPTAKAFTNKYYCYRSGKWNTKDSHGCDAAEHGDLNTIGPGAGWGDGGSLLYGHLGRLFFGEENPFHNAPPTVSKDKYRTYSGLEVPTPEAIDYSQSVPVKSLKELYDRQRASLDSLQCMYVSGDLRPKNRERFPAFDNTNLRNLWRDAVTNVFSSGAWRRVVYRDIPPGEVKEVFAQYAQQHGITDLEDFNRPCAPGEPLSSCGVPPGGMKILYGGRIPDSPSLPTPSMSGAALDRMPPARMQRPGGSSSKTGALTAIIAAGALAYIFTQRK